MGYVDSINSKDQKHFKACNFDKFQDDDGMITHKMESGITTSFFRWYYMDYKLTIQFLTHAELVEIFTEIIAEMSSSGYITLFFAKLKKAGKFNIPAKEDIDPSFYTDPSKVEISRIAGTDLWNLTLLLEERSEDSGGV